MSGRQEVTLSLSWHPASVHFSCRVSGTHHFRQARQKEKQRLALIESHLLASFLLPLQGYVSSWRKALPLEELSVDAKKWDTRDSNFKGWHGPIRFSAGLRADATTTLSQPQEWQRGRGAWASV